MAGPREELDEAFDERAARAVLAAPPAVPRDLDLFSSNTLFGEPGIYPQGTPMEPAPGPAVTESGARLALHSLGFVDALARFDAAPLVERVPDPGPRAGLAALAGTVAEPLLDAFVAGAGVVTTLGLGAPASPGRVVGPPLESAEPGVRVVNDRYHAEHPALLTASLAHDLLWNPGTAGQYEPSQYEPGQYEPSQYEEVVLHAIGAMIHVQLVAHAPELGRRGTELARRQNSLAITLLNSRRPGRADVSLIAPDGPGTIPGGAPGMQTPDFWSIPFAAGTPRATDAPPGLGAVLARVVRAGTVLPVPLRYDEELGALLTAHLDRGWLPIRAQLVVARALGLVGGAAATGDGR